ncbi:hypothetical protein [Alkalilimnicola ehrlichii]|nr:hypothetical protein [Alkalilimnicola ehrlichii]
MDQNEESDAPRRQHPSGAASRFHIAGHPLHPMLVTFPIAFFPPPW